MQEVPQETFKIEIAPTVYTSGKNIFATSSQKNKINICSTMFWKTEYMVYPFQTYSKLYTLKILAQYKST